MSADTPPPADPGHLLSIIGGDDDNRIRFCLQNESTVVGCMIRWPEGWHGYIFDGPTVQVSSTPCPTPEECAGGLVTAWAQRQGMIAGELDSYGNA